MLTSDLVRATVYKASLRPSFLAEGDSAWLQSAEELLEMFRRAVGSPIAFILDEMVEAIEGEDLPVVWKGLARVLEARCHLVPAEKQVTWQARLDLFARAAILRQNSGFDAEKRAELVSMESAQIGANSLEFLEALYADVPGHETISAFEDISAGRLLEEYNLALAQGVVLRSEWLEVELQKGSTRQIRNLISAAKFHQLHWDLTADIDQPEKNIRIRFDGPMSLFDSTTKYGIRLACFLPTALAVEEAKISASLIWGKRPARKVIWEYHGSKVPFPNRHRLAPPAHPEIKGLHKLWQSTENDWELDDCCQVLPFGESQFWIPDYLLKNRSDGRMVFVEILADWKKDRLTKMIQGLSESPEIPWLLVAKGSSKRAGFDHPGLGWYRSFPSPEKLLLWVESRAIKPLPG